MVHTQAAKEDLGGELARGQWLRCTCRQRHLCQSTNACASVRARSPCRRRSSCGDSRLALPCQPAPEETACTGWHGRPCRPWVRWGRGSSASSRVSMRRPEPGAQDSAAEHKAGAHVRRQLRASRRCDVCRTPATPAAAEAATSAVATVCQRYNHESAPPKPAMQPCASPGANHQSIHFQLCQVVWLQPAAAGRASGGACCRQTGRWRLTVVTW